MADVFDHIAALDRPLPTRADVHPDWVLDEALDEAHRERYEAAAELREYWNVTWDRVDGTGDPVLTEIEETRQAQLRAEQRMRLLIAYAREFVSPRPYTLAALAESAGMSISGIRTAYDIDDEVPLIQERTGLRPRRRPSGADGA